MMCPSKLDVGQSHAHTIPAIKQKQSHNIAWLESDP